MPLKNTPPVMQQIGRAFRGFMRAYEGRLGELGFSMSQVPVMAALNRSGKLTQAELARIVQVEQPSMAQLLARMERDGLIERQSDPNDKRSKLITLTAEALLKAPEAKRLLDDAHVGLLEGFTAEEADSLISMLQRLNANLERVIDQQ